MKTIPPVSINKRLQKPIKQITFWYFNYFLNIKWNCIVQKNVAYIMQSLMSRFSQLVRKLTKKE